MKFAYTNLLWLLALLLPVLTGFLIWSWRAKQRQIARFVQSRLLANLTVGVSQGRQKLRLILLGTSVMFLLLAAAGPQFGTDWQEARQQGLDVIVAVDTSRSMLATDIAPNRLARAKLAALDLMRLAKSDRLGLIAFAGSAFLQCPLTLDEDAFRQNVETLNVGIIPQGGTAIGEAIDVAMKAVAEKNDNHKVLVIFTDGEDHDSEAVSAAQKAAKEGLKIFTIGVGTPDGELIRVPDESGKPGFLKDDSGNAVKSRLNETLLQQIATEAHGFYLPLRGTRSMETLYARGLAPLPKSDSTTKLIRVYREQFQWPLVMAISCLMLELFLPQRRRVVRPDDPWSQTKSPAAKLALLLVATAFLPSIAHSSPATARQLYDQGRFKDALSEYQRLLDKQQKADGGKSSSEGPDNRPPEDREKTDKISSHGDPRLQFNAGAAAYKAGRFEQAEDHFNKALLTDDASLLQQAFYNLGNTHYQSGESETDPQKKLEQWEKALKDYEGALSLQSNDPSAKHNQELVQRRLEELKKQQQQDSNSKDGKDQKDKKSSEQDKKQDQNKNQQDKEKQDQAKNNPSQEDKKSSDSKQKPDSEKDQKQEQQAQNKSGQDKPGEPEKPGQSPGEKPDDKRQKQPGAQATASAAGSQMTPQQARQMLDAQKGDDRPLIFLPADAARSRNRAVKDW